MEEENTEENSIPWIKIIKLTLRDNAKAKEHPQPAILMALAEQEPNETPAFPACSGGT